MEEAFQAALDRVVRRHAAPRLNSRNLQVVSGAAAKRVNPTPLSASALGKLTYSAKKLGRRWSSYTHQEGDGPRRLVSLRDDWIVLAAALAPLPTDQQVDVLDGFVSGMELGDRPGLERKRR